MEDCVFCKIVKKQINSEIALETNHVIAFKDIHPSADLHILVVPKKHIVNFEDIKKVDSQIISEMISVAQQIIKNEKPSKYRVIINGGSYLEVNHLHWHLQGGNLTKHAKEALVNDN